MKLKSSPISQLKKHKTLFRFAAYFLLFLIVFFIEKGRVLGFPQPQLLDYLKPTSCGVVLTGAPGRIREAFEVFAQKKFKKLIISGVYKDVKLHEIFPQLPFYPEVDPEDVVLEKISGSTYANAYQSLLVVETLKCNSILLMTSDIHMYRSYRTFRAVFPDTIRIDTYPIVNPAKENSLVDVYFETFKSIFYDIILFFTSFAT